MKYAASFCLLTLISCATTEQDCICKTGSWNSATNSCKVEDSVICTAEYKPVCGCDGVQYSNACIAHKNGVKHFSFGECE